MWYICIDYPIVQCRASVTATPVPCLAVVNVLDGMVPGMLSMDDVKERRRCKAAWASKGAFISDETVSQLKAAIKGSYQQAGYCETHTGTASTQGLK